MASRIQLLYVVGPDQPRDRVPQLIDRDEELAVNSVASARAAWELIEQDTIHCVVTRQDLGDTNGLSFLDRVRDEYPDLPFILFTRGNVAIASQATAADVTEYLQDFGGYRSVALLAQRVKEAAYEREAERALEHTEEWYRRLVDAGDNVIVVVDDHGRFEYLNPGVEAVLGYAPSELIGESGFDYIHEDDLGQASTLFQEMVADPTIQPTSEFRFKHADGSWIWLEVLGENLAEDPVLGGHVIYARDITERKQREQRLRRGRRRFHAIFNGQNLLVALLDPDGTIQEVNDTALSYIEEDATALRGDEIWNTPWFAFDKEVQRAIRECINRAAGGESLESEIRIGSADGEVHHIRGTVRPITDALGEIQSLLLIGQDITERIRREQDRDLRYEAIFDHTYQFTGLLSPDGILLEANQTALDFGDLDAEDVIGKPLWETHWWQVDEATKEDLRDAIERAASGEFVRYDVEVQGQDENIVIDFSIRPVTDEDGEIEYLIPEGRNITDLEALREREEELERQNERLESFASIVAHDLRNPLGVAKHRVEMALSVAQAEASDHLEAADHALERVESLLDDLFELATQGERVDSLEAVSLLSLVHACRETTDMDGATLEADGDTTVMADPSRLQELLENLFRNCGEHGGDVIRVGPLSSGFYVEDNGPGIPASERDAVLEAGYTTSSDGTGFGLAIVREIVDAHGWELRTTEGKAGGARFEITGIDTAE